MDIAACNWRNKKNFITDWKLEGYIVYVTAIMKVILESLSLMDHPVRLEHIVGSYLHGHHSLLEESQDFIIKIGRAHV